MRRQAEGDVAAFVEDHELFDAMEAALDSMLGDRSQMVNNHIEGVLRDEQ